MRQYQTILKRVFREGKHKSDRQHVGNISVLAHTARYDLSKGFPLITTRSLRGSFKAAVIELLWFLTGESRIDFLQKHGVHLWDQWATPEICAMYKLQPGNLGNIYGPQWRHWHTTTGGEIDQIQRVVDDLRNNPDGRRHIVSAWNPEDVTKVFVAPCHCLFNFYHAEGQLDLHLFQRSADVPIGVPFNIAEYALLLKMMAQVTNLAVGELVHTTSDTHIYLDQIDAMKILLERSPRKLPTVEINPDVKDIFSFRLEDFELRNYNPHPAIKGIPCAV